MHVVIVTGQGCLFQRLAECFPRWLPDVLNRHVTDGIHFDMVHVGKFGHKATHIVCDHSSSDARMKVGRQIFVGYRPFLSNLEKPRKWSTFAAKIVGSRTPCPHLCSGQTPFIRAMGPLLAPPASFLAPIFTFEVVDDTLADKLVCHLGLPVVDPL